MHRMLRILRNVFAGPALLLTCLLVLSPSQGRAAAVDYSLAAGDVIRVSVYQNPDLTTDARLSENGNITFPLLGTVKLGGLAIADAEALIAKGLEQRGFVKQPQVSILLQELRGSQVDVIGQVNRPGRFPLETTSMRLTNALALAGGISPTGADTVVVTGERDGKPFRQEVDVAAIYASDGNNAANIQMAGGDSVFVNRAPVFYIYGQVQKPGVFRLERDMTLMQAVAAGGGLTPRGTLRGIKVNRRDAQGKLGSQPIALEASLQANDVIVVSESLF